MVIQPHTANGGSVNSEMAIGYKPEIFQSAALVCRDAARHSQPTTLGTKNVWGAVIAVLS
jgi:hypothetical protein